MRAAGLWIVTTPFARVYLQDGHKELCRGLRKIRTGPGRTRKTEENNMLSYYIDKSEIFGCTVHLTGWAVSDTGTLPEYRVTERHGEEMKFSFRKA